MTKVLVFESDGAFAQILSVGLAGYGCEVKVVDDGEVGIEVASKDKPDLILLTIELPRMNGFSVCNKLKRHGDLKSIPLALLSSDATDETFDQHKRLRTRADAYVHKPVSVDGLVAQLADIFPLTKQAQTEEMADDDVVIDEELTMEDAEPSQLIDVEADAAFGNIMMRAAAPSGASTPAKSEDFEMEDLELEDDGHLVVAAPAGTAQQASAQQASLNQASLNDEQTAGLNATIATLKAEIQELSSGLSAAKASAEAEADAKTQVSKKKDAEIELLQKEIETLRDKLNSNETSGTAREFLDLREKLNRKDKEILDIRDELTSKEKALIKANDEAITVGREKADLVDQVSGLLQTKAELEKQNHTLSQDKDQAQKRGDDFKAKSERLQSDLDGKTHELKQAIESHENAIATREAQEAALRDDHQEALRNAAENAELAKQQAVAQAIAQTEEKAEGEKEAALVAAAEAARRERTDAVAARGVELKAEHDAKMAALHRANEESLRKLRAEHAHEKDQEQRAAAERLAERERELIAEKEQALAELGAQKAAAEQERDQIINELQFTLAERTRERDLDRQTIQDREGNIAQLEASMAAVRAELSETLDRLGAESQLLARVRQKASEDAGSMQVARDALGQALVQLEQAQQRPIP